MKVAAVRALVNDALDGRAFPAAVIEVGRAGGPTWREAFGRLRYAPTAARTDEATIFDLASLTKVIATTSLAMRQVDRGAIDLNTRIAARLRQWPASSPIALRHLLDHSSGLPAHARLWETAEGRAAYERAIATMATEGGPGERAVYSDLGFMLLGFLLEDVGGAPLDVQFAEFVSDAGLAADIRFNPPDAWRPRIAPTEIDAWRGRELVGEVHDENAAALGGIAGHAGLFGSAEAVGAFARLVLETRDRVTKLGSPALLRTFTTRTGVPASSRALGWDTMLPTSSCGRLMSSRAIGHTGYTGTSLWIDLEKDVYVVILTNRVHPSRANEQLPALRPLLHDAVMEGLGD